MIDVDVSKRVAVQHPASRHVTVSSSDITDGSASVVQRCHCCASRSPYSWCVDDLLLTMTSLPTCAVTCQRGWHLKQSTIAAIFCQYLLPNTVWQSFLLHSCFFPICDFIVVFSGFIADYVEMPRGIVSMQIKCYWTVQMPRLWSEDDIFCRCTLYVMQQVLLMLQSNRQVDWNCRVLKCVQSNFL